LSSLGPAALAFPRHERVRRAFGARQLGRVIILRLDAIPRNEAGKIRRDRLRGRVKDLLRGRPRAPAPQPLRASA